MTTQLTIKREVEKLKEKVKPKREDRIVIRMWLPDSDPRHGMTDEELENYQPSNKFIIKPWSPNKKEANKPCARALCDTACARRQIPKKP